MISFTPRAANTEWARSISARRAQDGNPGNQIQTSHPQYGCDRDLVSKQQGCPAHPTQCAWPRIHAQTSYKDGFCILVPVVIGGTRRCTQARRGKVRGKVQ